jgi:DNA invertase Pin-like site-specific DNA recombinase
VRRGKGHPRVGYVCVSTAEQADSGAGLEAQRAAIRSACQQRGWELVGIHEDAGFRAATLARPGLGEALSAVESSEATVLVVAKLDRLSRSLLDFAALMERSRRKRWALGALDLGVDTTTPAGEAMANLMATFAQFERRLIGRRTKDALAVKVCRSPHRSGLGGTQRQTSRCEHDLARRDRRRGNAHAGSRTS